MNDITGVLVDLQQTVDEKGLQYDVLAYYRDLYNMHKALNGSYKAFLSDGESYQRKMMERYDCILNCINETLEESI